MKTIRRGRGTKYRRKPEWRAKERMEMKEMRRKNDTEEIK